MQPANPLQPQGEVVGARSPQNRYSHRVRWSGMQPANPLQPQGEVVGDAAHKPATATG